MSDRINTTLGCDALRMAYWRRKPAAGLILHSDRGVQYASHAYRQLLKEFKMVESMSRKGNTDRPDPHSARIQAIPGT